MKRKVLSALLALAMVFSLASVSLAAEPVKEINIFGIGDFGGALDDSGKPTGNPGGARVVGAMKALTAEAVNPIVVTGGTIYTGIVSPACQETPSYVLDLYLMTLEDSGNPISPRPSLYDDYGNYIYRD